MITLTSSVRQPSLPFADARVLAQPPEYSPAVTDRVYRAASIYLSVPLARIGVLPNAITLAWIVLGLGAIALLSAGSYAVRVTGALLLQFAYLLDYVDGEVARLNDRRSRVGEFLDLLGHGLHKVMLPFPVAWVASGAGVEPRWLLAGVAATAILAVGDASRFYAACVAGDFGSGDLGHTVRPRPRGISPWRVANAVFFVSFETPGLYGIVALAAIGDLWVPLIVWWAVGGPVWIVCRTHRYLTRLRAR